MAEASKRKVVLIVGLAVVATIAIGLGSFWFLQNKDKKNNGNSSLTFDQYNQNLALTNLKKDITNPKVLELSLGVQNKDYDQVIAKAKVLCSTLTGNDQVLCYNQYSQALLAKNDLKTLAELAPVVLKLDAIKKNVTALKSWQRIQDSVNKGVNPNTVVDAEARN